MNLDKLTYAGNLANLASVESNPAYTFVQGDICDAELLARLFAEHRPRAVVHFAAESHVDRSICGARGISADKYRWHIHAVAGGTRILRIAGWRGAGAVSLPPCIDGRSLWNAEAGRSSISRGDSLRAEQSLCRIEGGERSSGSRVGAYLWAAGHYYELLEQLWSLSVS